ncbi:PREDICTED: charged multivesicular body protein 1b [Nicrophorus vespilloides]|uniref:Charged multivesicular body protein 1b n=1 Tax=Nicrophorus vespilloides TaxID=110193 RepID=A0ABM1MXS0_NICVS|nr:PREDICTED: charged multivesicular body protein 1b [Nicrophorus vespilloides]
MGNEMSSSVMEKHLFNLKFAVKELERNSKRCEKEEKQEKAKTKQAIQKGNMEVARIHAENAIRQKNQAINYLRMSARVDAVSSRVQSALTTRKVTNSMAGVVKAMDAAMKSMNLEKISNLMDKFEQQFEDLDVQSGVMENAMSQNVTTMVPQNDVESLMQQVADEAGLELNMELPEGVQNTSVGIGTSTNMSQEQDELSQRLARLRQTE